jgi:hypothetical protein
MKPAEQSAAEEEAENEQLSTKSEVKCFNIGDSTIHQFQTV